MKEKQEMLTYKDRNEGKNGKCQLSNIHDRMVISFKCFGNSTRGKTL